MKQQHLCNIRWLTGIIISFVGWCLLLVSFYYGAMIFYVQERILFILPAIAKKVSIEELISDPEKFDGHWVRVEGEIWRRQINEAVLVQLGTGPEIITAQKSVGISDDQEKLFGDETLKPLPDHSLYMHNFSVFGMRTVSVFEIDQDRKVEIVGEFERKLKGYDNPHIDLVAIINPRQNQFWFQIRMSLVAWFILIFTFISLNHISKRIRRGNLKS